MKRNFLIFTMLFLFLVIYSCSTEDSMLATHTEQEMSVEMENFSGSTQKFYFMKVVIDDDTLHDGGNLGQPYGSSQSFIDGIYVDYLFSENIISSTEIEYVIVIY